MLFTQTSFLLPFESSSSFLSFYFASHKCIYSVRKVFCACAVATNICALDASLYNNIVHA